jgi:hypothetical protein
MSRRDRQPSIDELYGLEPVIEPGDGAGGASAAPQPTVTQELSCPWCGECFTTLIDLSAGSQDYVEDCQICCQPVRLLVRAGEDGELEGFEALRDD